MTALLLYCTLYVAGLFVPTDSIVVDNDTFKFSYDYSSRIRSKEEMLSFVKYIKTQQSVFGEDCKAVIRTMFNRLEHHNVTWYEYYSTPSINCSASIRKLRSGRLNISVGTTGNDSLIVDYVQKVLFDKVEYFNPNILYFESCRYPPNRAPHLSNNLAFKHTHRFYYK